MSLLYDLQYTRFHFKQSCWRREWLYISFWIILSIPTKSLFLLYEMSTSTTAKKFIMDLPQMKYFILGQKNDMFRLYIMQKTEKYIFLNLFLLQVSFILIFLKNRIISFLFGYIHLNEIDEYKKSILGSIKKNTNFINARIECQLYKTIDTF